MAEFPALPLWTDAYLADCAHLSDAEHGRYLLILFELWRAPKQRLPNDDDWLARRFRRTPEQVRAELRPLIAEFCKSDGNFITQKRLAREWKYVAERSRAQSERAKRRWKKEKPDARADAGPHVTGNAPTPTPTPTPTPILERERRARAGEPVNGQPHAMTVPSDWQPDQADRDWIAYAKPDLAPADVERELTAFRLHCAENNRTTFDRSASFRRWMTRARPAAPADDAPLPPLSKRIDLARLTGSKP